MTNLVSSVFPLSKPTSFSGVLSLPSRGQFGLVANLTVCAGWMSQAHLIRVVEGCSHVSDVVAGVPHRM